jgi:putative tryptophan/tyrosine transport system substrate-binding protein
MDGRMQFGQLKRRQFIMLLGGAAAAWPLVARAQQAKIPRIGIIGDTPFWDHFRRGLADFGYTEGRNIAIEYHSTEGNFDQMREEARKLASIPVDAIVAYGSTGTRAARQATTTIPIVMIAVGDPVRAGFVTTLARPGGNVTGNSNVGPELTGKRLEILKELVPSVIRVVFAFNPDNDSNLAFLEELIIAVPALGLQLISVPIRTSDDFDGAFAAMMQRQPNALLTTNDDLFLQHMEQIIDFTARHRLPTMYQAKENVMAGGLIAYGATLSDLFRRGAWYVNKVLQGVKPADLAVEQPTKLELVINLKTAKALGLTVPPSLLARAHVVIE